MANTAAPRKKTTMLAAVSVREAKIRERHERALGEPALDQHEGEPAARARWPSVPSVAAEPQPLTSVRTIA